MCINTSALCGNRIFNWSSNTVQYTVRMEFKNVCFNTRHLCYGNGVLNWSLTSKLMVEIKCVICLVSLYERMACQVGIGYSFSYWPQKEMTSLPHRLPANAHPLRTDWAAANTALHPCCQVAENLRNNFKEAAKNIFWQRNLLSAGLLIFPKIAGKTL